MKKKWLLNSHDPGVLKKIGLAMRLTLILMIGFVITVNAKSYSQTTHLNIYFNNQTIRDVIEYVEANSEFVFLYKNEDFNLDKKVNMRMRDATIYQILDKVLEGEKVVYDVYERQIVIRRQNSSKVSLQQREKTVTGVVTDDTGGLLPGVTVIIKGSTKGTVTNAEGKFHLEVASENTTLVFSFVGMKTQEIPVEGRTTFTVVMEEESIGLEEVVAVGYGVTKKMDLTGAVGSVKIDESLHSLPTVDFGQALYGKVPGLQVLNTSGRPGESSVIQVRGVNSIMAGATPLLVIDGIPMPSYDLNAVNFSDIESIDVLKDASSTAIYGSRGANGVILVTTKSGNSGKPKLSVDYNYSIQKVIRFAEFMNSEEYAQAAIDAAQNGWIESGGDPSAPNTYEARGNYLFTWPEELEHPENLPDTDWQNLIYHTAPMHKVHIGISGGDEKSDYYISAGVVNQEGIMLLTDYQKYTANLKGDSKVTDWMTVGAMTNTAFHKENLYPSSFQNIVQYPTIYPLYGDDGKLYGGPSTIGWSNYEQVLYNITGHPFTGFGDTEKEEKFDWLGNIYAEIQILPELKFKSSFNASYKRKDHSKYQATDRNIGEAYLRVGSFTSDMTRRTSYSVENFFNYNKSFKEHSISALAGYEFNKRDYYYLLGNRTNYDNDLLPYLSAGTKVADATDNIYSSSLISYLARVQYNYKQKYLASASIRRDGSSKFGPNNKWGNFPSVSAGWRVSEENFMGSIPFIENLKLRGSLGYTGNDNIADYVWISQMAMARVALGDNLTTSYYPSSIENADLKWERTKQYNLGIDLGLYNNRIYLEADVYKSVSDGLLLDVPIPSTTGFASIFKNIGELQNKGIELNLTTQNMVGKFKWESVFTFSANRNKITKMGPDDAPRIYSTGESMKGIDVVGQPMHQFFGYTFDGVFMSQAEVDANTIEYPYTIHPGDAKYKDINSDGVIDTDDRGPIGDAQPDFIWSVNNVFKYKNFDFSFLWQGVHGNDLFNGNYRRSMIYHEGRNYLERLNNRWRSEAEPGDGTVPKVTVLLDGFEKTRSSFWITDGSYARLKNVTFGYTLPVNVVQRIGVASARLYFSGFNLLTITDAETEDPENFNVRNSIDSPDGRGVSHGVYPTAKTYTFGININF